MKKNMKNKEMKLILTDEEEHEENKEMKLILTDEEEHGE